MYPDGILRIYENSDLSFNECYPLEKVKINYKTRHDWVTKELKADIKNREELFKTSKKNPTEHNIRAHKKFRNIVLSRQRQAKRKHYKEQYVQSLNEQNYKKFRISQDF